MQSGHDSSSIPENEWVHMPRWQIVIFGQVLSVLLSVMWASQATLYLKCKWNAPAFSCFWAYLLLSFHTIPLMWKGRTIRKGFTDESETRWFLGIVPLKASPWVYFGMALLSFYGNYCYLLAVSLTTVTSLSLVDAISVPTAMILSHCFLRRRYKKLHFLGAALCLTGVAIGVIVDFVANRIHQDASVTDSYEDTDGSEEFPNKIAGDLLACAGAILFGMNDVMAEYSVHRFGGTTEYLGMIGFFGIFLSAFQMTLSERQIISDTFNGMTGCTGYILPGLLVAYVVGQFSRKSGLATFLTMSDAALLQLSLLTSDLYTALFSIVYQHILPRPSSWIAMAIVMSGIVVYEMSAPPLACELEVHAEAKDENDTPPGVSDGVFRSNGEGSDHSNGSLGMDPTRQVV